MLLASRRAQRMERHHKRGRGQAALNLVSLMDIFTILVFFLLVFSSNAEILPSTKSVQLPESVAEKLPEPAVVVTVNDEDILVQGRKVASVTEAMRGSSQVIEPLRAELDRQAHRVLKPSEAARREVTIMGDKEIPYTLLKRIMLTCARAAYDNVSLAVLKKEPA